MTGERSCDVCKYDGSWHYDENGNASRCPNWLMAEEAERAKELRVRQQNDREEAAQRIVHDAAQRFFLFSANAIQDEIKAAGLDGDSGVMGRAFTHALREAWIVHTGNTEPSTKRSTHGKPVAIYKSLLREGRRSA